MLQKTNVSRRRFLKTTAATACAALTPACLWADSRGRLSSVEARYYTKIEGNRIICKMCPRECIVSPGKRGHCEVRENQNGIYVSLVYGRIAAHHVDPIEKKPFYHVMPGNSAFSVATAGCNVDCKFCQNWELAQRRPEDLENVAFTPQELVAYTKRCNSKIIAFTYNEPTIQNEFVYDVASEAKAQGVKTVVISNGYINEAPMNALCNVIDAYKVDLKSFSPSYYEEVVGGRLGPVLDSLVRLKSNKIWIEIVYLTVPTLNDKPAEVNEMAKWILSELGADVPVHFSRFYPKYKLKNLPPTPVSTLENLRKTAQDAGLHHVYLGNVPGHEGENTICPSCNKLLIGRMGYRIFQNHMQGGTCKHCGDKIAGVWGA